MSYSIDDFNSSMTVFYSKTTGKINCIGTGILDLSLYGDEAEDYGQIFDFVVLPNDPNVIGRKSDFKINLETKQLEIKTEAVQNSYPIASS